MMLSEDWKELDRGVLDEEEVLQRFIDNDPKLEEEIRKVFAHLDTLISERPRSAEWIRSLKNRGCHTYYLSNFFARIEEEGAAQLTCLQELDGGIMSYKVHLLKPDPAIYQTLLDTYGLKAEESVFLDDSPVNVEAARDLGMAGIVVTSQEQAMEELDQLLLNQA